MKLFSVKHGGNKSEMCQGLHRLNWLRRQPGEGETTEEWGKEKIRCLRDKEQVLKCKETIKILKMALERQKRMLSFPHHL